MTSFAVKAEEPGFDTDGYEVVHIGAFVVMITATTDASGETSQFLFGSEPYDQTEGKSGNIKVPDSFTERAERFYTTAELNVRCGPSSDFKTYGTVLLGTPVDKIGFMWSGSDDWAFVLLQHGGGWVNTDYLTDNPYEGEGPD